MSGRYHFDSTILDKKRESNFGNRPLSGVFADDNGNYGCFSCGCAWKAESIYQWWPLSIRWNWDKRCWRWFHHHGWQSGWDGIERRVFGQTFHFGPLKVCLGKDKP